MNSYSDDDDCCFTVTFATSNGNEAKSKMKHPSDIDEQWLNYLWTASNVHDLFICSIHEVCIYTSSILSSWNVLQCCSFMNRIFHVQDLSMNCSGTQYSWSLLSSSRPCNVHERFMNRTISCSRMILELFMCWSCILYMNCLFMIHEYFMIFSQG
jgi:hypothetical protein